MRELRTEILVIGAGPAGIAAAVSAERAGARALLVDMQAEPGGQVWRGQWDKSTNSQSRRWIAALRQSPVECRYGLRLIDFAAPGLARISHTPSTAAADTLALTRAAPSCRLDVVSLRLRRHSVRGAHQDGRLDGLATNGCEKSGLAVFDSPDGPLRVRCERLIVATGARERLLPFPGWTLPGVFGAGGLQVLVKNGWPVAGKRIVVAGSGPLLLAAASSLRAAGAQVLLVAEQTTAMDLARFAVRLARHPAKLAQAAALRLRLAGVPYRCNAWVERADGDEQLRSVRLRIGRYSERLECDALAVGFGLVPNLEIAQLLGCTLADGAVVVDEHQHSSVAGIYFAGESCGIGGVDQALIQGEIAGRAAAGSARLSFGLRRARARSEHFARSLHHHFTLRDELRQLAAADTVLCRCESVRYGAAQACRSQRDARLQLRLGMGHCQGRVCGAACAFLFGWDAATPRPPLAPVPLSCFTVSPTEENPQESP